ncbi:hypothetical protein BGZ60DRAFT_285146 [Tricladium varicosporioides]|nr:hypothetical protein BGZ60DRAFT_285146 [Hymenoscyphus varicosporioides]
MITHCFGDDVTKGRVISKFLRATFPHLYKDIYNICSSYKKLMDQIIKSLEGPEDEDDDEEVEDLTEVPSVFYPPDSVMELAVNVKLVQSAEKANLPCMPTPVVIYTYIVVHGIPNCPTILYRDWSIARPETARFMVIYWAPKILEFMTDQTTKAYLDLKSLSQVCKPEDRAEALAWVKKNNPEHKRGRLGHDSEVTSAQRKLIPGKKWMQEAIAYSLITHRQKPIHDWPNFTFLRDRTPSVQRIRTAKKIVSGETATLPAATPENDEDIVMEDVAPDLTMDTITSRSRPPSPYPEFKQRSTSNATVRNVSELKPAGKRAVLAPRQVLKDVRTREINRHGDGLVNENDSDSSSTSSPSSSPPPNPIVADQTTADTIKFRPLPDGSYNCTVEGCAHIEYKPKTREGYQQMLDHYSTHVGQKVALVVGEQMRTGRTTGHLQQRIRRADLF